MKLFFAIPKHILKCNILTFFLACILSFLTLVLSLYVFPISLHAQTPENADSFVYTNPIDSYTLDIAGSNVMVIESGRGMRLFMKDIDEIIHSPLASRIMTAIIAIDSVSSGTMITISNVAARQPDASVLLLRAGERYSLEYLLHGMLLLDNSAAAIALAEQIRGSEAEFTELMNERASAYLLENTVFRNSTGEFNENQHTTVADLSRLIRHALTLPEFTRIVQTNDIPFFLSTQETKHVISNLEPVRPLIPDMRGGIKASSEGGITYFIKAVNSSMNIVIIGHTNDSGSITDDLTTITESVFSDFEVTVLVRENQSFPADITLENDTFGLRFNSTITYIRPRDSEFIRNTVFEKNEIIDYPILMNRSVARVTFELMDGTRITADLYPDRTIYRSGGLYNRIISVYNENPGISNLIIALSALFIILMIYKILRAIYVFSVQITNRKN